MSNSMLGIGISGLSTAQANLLTTSHNISNADTPGFSRQQVVQNTNSPQLTANGFIGRGVQASTVQRIYSESLVNQSLQVQTQSSQLDSHYTQIKQIDNLLANPGSGLSPALLNFFNAVQDVATDSAFIPSRQAMLSNAESLISRFNSLDQRFTEIRDHVNEQIASSVTAINSLSKQIASLNQNIHLAQGQAGGQSANDLLDQRDVLTNQLSQLININPVRQSDGTFNIFIGNGQPLVVGTEDLPLKAMPSPEDPTEMTIGLATTGNKFSLLPENQIQGGRLGGLLAFRADTLDSAQNSLGRVAVGLAQTFNAQHRLGQDLNGDIGSDFFTVSAPKITSAMGNNPTSNISATISDIGILTTSDYQFTFDGTDYALTRLSDKTSNRSSIPPSTAAPLVLDGLSVTGADINATESFLIQPTRNGAKNITLNIKGVSEVAAATPIRTNASLSNTGTGTISAGTVNSLPIDPNLQQPVIIAFHTPFDGQFDVTGTGKHLPASNQIFTEGDDISFNGFTVQINGNPDAGDTFTVDPNSHGYSDNRNALLLGGLQTQNTLAGGTANYQSAYGQIVSQIGNKTRELEVTSKMQVNLLGQMEQSIQSLSGVNLDEEAANLIRYQQAYQASSKIIEISNTLFDTLLRIS
ncbi:flagellar hook-associated protein 1 FlgK [Nitrosomonas cryotolerans]|uniref:Flagellar hook-associated protein 1 n=1 Tax=Nitrosomonas cryotolerans ATCC 49181 TaxID=1131553 RepID=A0A1N6ILI0_9PROT|nr:flagellar hook-associated protein FlgK [Nitrosomonas cryotolerans]SFP37122.1 flagellar hook-associated protein 1 FlgK [Nitrosomonas cryotolerans]SIO32894.1 flagellar hook-associated protein 1 FlgK [Nitrosomonas cryotolerans ATCC 49181]